MPFFLIPIVEIYLFVFLCSVFEHMQRFSSDANLIHLSVAFFVGEGVLAAIFADISVVFIPLRLYWQNGANISNF